MPKPKLSLVYATYERADLLARHVRTINDSEFDLSSLEVVCIDDASGDSTADVVRGYDGRIDFKYVRLRKPDGLWRDTASVINCGIRMAAGDAVALTHPEMLFGRRSLAFLAGVRDGEYRCCKGYYLTPQQTADIDAVPWREEGPLAVRRFPDFYASDPNGHPDYRPESIERIDPWESWICASHTRRTWSELGGFTETDKWGSCDLNWLNRRRALGIPNSTCKDPAEYVVHQWHPAPRVMADAFSQARGFTADEARYPAVSHLWGPIP